MQCRPPPVDATGCASCRASQKCMARVDRALRMAREVCAPHMRQQPVDQVRVSDARGLTRPPDDVNSGGRARQNAANAPRHLRPQAPEIVLKGRAGWRARDGVAGLRRVFRPRTPPVSFVAFRHNCSQRVRSGAASRKPKRTLRGPCDQFCGKLGSRRVTSPGSLLVCAPLAKLSAIEMLRSPARGTTVATRVCRSM